MNAGGRSPRSDEHAGGDPILPFPRDEPAEELQQPLAEERVESALRDPERLECLDCHVTETGAPEALVQRDLRERS